jgi:hypothetical protein
LTQEPPVPVARRLAAVEGDPTVHYHVLDPDRVPVRVLVRRPVDHPRWIEHDEVGPRALAHDPAIVNARA